MLIRWIIFMKIIDWKVRRWILLSMVNPTNRNSQLDRLIIEKRFWSNRQVNFTVRCFHFRLLVYKPILAKRDASIWRIVMSLCWVRAIRCVAVSIKLNECHRIDNDVIKLHGSDAHVAKSLYVVNKHGCRVKCGLCVGAFRQLCVQWTMIAMELKIYLYTWELRAGRASGALRAMRVDWIYLEVVNVVFLASKGKANGSE